MYMGGPWLTQKKSQQEVAETAKDYFLSFARRIAQNE
jgi:hypothetical protein